MKKFTSGEKTIPLSISLAVSIILFLISCEEAFRASIEVGWLMGFGWTGQLVMTWAPALVFLILSIFLGRLIYINNKATQ